MVPPVKRRIIRSLTAPNIAVEPRNPDNAPTLYTDAPSVYPVLKTPHLGRYYMIWIPSDEPLSHNLSIGSSGAKAIDLACLCMI
jgi:hypothetical protein